jgi:hypothetical protein
MRWMRKPVMKSRPGASSERGVAKYGSFAVAACAMWPYAMRMHYTQEQPSGSGQILLRLRLSLVLQ